VGAIDRSKCHLDAGHGDCWLKEPRVAEVVANALRFFVNARCALGAWVVIPNHVHARARRGCAVRRKIGLGAVRILNGERRA
jgi:hypothetical protein